jgi:hypothetical protein
MPLPKLLRPLLPTAAALAVAVPALWWGSEWLDRGGAGDVAAAEALAQPESPAAAARSAGEAELLPAVPGGAAAVAVPAAAEGRRSVVGQDTPTLLDPTSAPVGLVLRGELRTRVPGLTGAVLLRAHGPDGRCVDGLGSLGSAYSLVGLTPGSWTLVLRGAAVLEQTHSLTLDRSQEEWTLDLELEPTPSLPVLLLSPAGERLETLLAEPGRDPASFPRLEVVGRELDPPVPAELTPTGAGSFRRARIGPDGELPEFSGWIDLRTPPPVELRVVQAGQELHRLAIESTSGVLHIVVEPLEESTRPALTANLVDAETGAPVEDAIVELYRAGESAPVRTRRPEVGGLLRMAGIGSGDWILSAWSPGRAQLLRSFRIEGESDYALGQLDLQRSVTFTGRLLAPDGRPLANRWVRWVLAAELEGRGGASTLGHEGVRTDSGGMFAIGGVPEGPVVLLAGGEEFAAQTFPVDVGRAVEPCDLRLVGGVLVSIPLLGSADQLHELVVRDAQGYPVFERSVVSGRTTQVTLARGSYTVEVRRGADRRLTRSFVIQDQPLELILQLDG